MTAIETNHAMEAVPAAKVPWRRSLVRTLLYGRNIDRSAKTRARLSLAVMVFALGYAIIAGRLIMFVAVPDSHMGRRTLAQDAVGDRAARHSRSQWRDLGDRRARALAVRGTQSNHRRR